MTTPLSGTVCSLGLAMVNLHTKFQVSSLSRARDILGLKKIKNGSRDVTTPTSGTVCRFVIIYQPKNMFHEGLSSVDWDMLCSTHTPNMKCLRLPASMDARSGGQLPPPNND